MLPAVDAWIARAVELIDLTSLNDDDTLASTRELAYSAQTSAGCVAALCVYPQFVPLAKATLADLGLAWRVKVATVANFPRGESTPAAAAREVAAAVAAGADEVDVVFPWRALMAGDSLQGRELVAQCRAAVGDRILKVIIESGELQTPALIRQASTIAIDGGGDFVKTSTGKVRINATLPAAEVILETIRDCGRPVGFKAAGGVRSTDDVAAYLGLADRVMGVGWATPQTFRFGASALLQTLLRAMAPTAPVGPDAGPQVRY